LDGDGTTNISIEMPNSTLSYSIFYDGFLCSDNSNCSVNSNSNGIINLTLTVGSEHTLEINGEDLTSPEVSIVIPTSGQTFSTSTASFEARTNENST
jgi:hypothetical protein